MKFLGKKKQTLQAEADSKSIINKDTSFAVREAYKALRTNIMFSVPKKTCKRIIVTSATLGDGKSTTAVNLALTTAQTGAKVLLIDCDLRRPGLGELLEVQKKKGLSNVIVFYKTFEETAVFGVRENLDLLPAGEIPPNPTELLGSDEFAKLLEKLSEKYEYIILDTPPVNLVTDTAILSKLADGIVMVVRSGKTHKDELKKAVASLNFVGGKILGFVLNEVDGAKGEKYAGYYMK